MCKFTHLRYTECPHDAILAKPRNTLLCRSAREFGLVQGIDRVPASCYPSDIESFGPDRIAIVHYEFGRCDACLRKPQKKLGINDDFVGEYLDCDRRELDELKQRVSHNSRNVQKMCRDLEYNDVLREKVPYIQHEWLRTTISKNGNEKYNRILVETFYDLCQWVDLLETLHDQQVPRDVYEPAYKFTVLKAEKAEEKAYTFAQFLKTLRGFGVSDNAYQTKLSFLGDELQAYAEGDSKPTTDFAHLEDGFLTPNLKENNSVSKEHTISIQPSQTPRGHAIPHIKNKMNLGIYIYPTTPGRDLPEVCQVTVLPESQSAKARGDSSEAEENYSSAESISNDFTIFMTE